MLVQVPLQPLHLPSQEGTQLGTTSVLSTHLPSVLHMLLLMSQVLVQIPSQPLLPLHLPTQIGTQLGTVLYSYKKISTD